jgi:hypothetical protein
MKKFLIILTYLISSFYCFQSSERKNDNKIYLIAIQEYIKQIDGYYFTDFYSDNKNKILYVQQEKYLNEIPNKVGKYQILMINRYNKKQYFGNNNSKLLTVVYPLKNNLQKHFINITPYRIEFYKNNYVQTVSDWTNVFFVKIENNLKFSKVENNGI